MLSASVSPAMPHHDVPLRVLIVDDSSHFRSAAKTLFETFPSIGDVATAPSGEAALAVLKSHSFDLMVLDLSMDGIGGLEVARRLRGVPGAPRIVMVSLYDEPEFRSAASSAGVEVFMNKPALAGELESLLARLFGAKPLAAAT
jgi:two-component system invasion response regulator UvrY